MGAEDKVIDPICWEIVILEDTADVIEIDPEVLTVIVKVPAFAIFKSVTW